MDVDSTLKKTDKRTSLLIICSPNNPTGNQFKEKDIKKILQEFNGIVIIDEAYVDFAEYSVMDWIQKFDNLVVLRTFSKAFGLAGMRLGFVVSNTSIVDTIKRATSPFTVNIITQKLITSVLKKWNYFKERIRFVKKEREWLGNNLAKIEGVTPYPSDANFVLFKVKENRFTSSEILRRLENRFVLARDRGNLPLLTNCIRVTVGTRIMNEAFITALKGVMGE